MLIVITARNFRSGAYNPVELLESAGYVVRDYSDMNFGAGCDMQQLTELVKDADIIIAGQEPLKGALLEKCPNLKLISRRGIGYDNVDTDACKELGIKVLRTVGAVEGAVAEMVMAYIMYFGRRVDLQNADMHAGIWKPYAAFGVRGRTLGLIGFGGIGKEIAKRAKGFGMEILYYCRHPQNEWESVYNVKYCDLDELLGKSDYVSVNVPLTEETENMFDKNMFLKMKKGSFFINIARSRIMDVNALKEILDTQHIAGAAIDVFPVEPCTDSLLMTCDNAVLTPHSSIMTGETSARINNLAAQNVIDYFNNNIDTKMILC